LSRRTLGNAGYLAQDTIVAPATAVGGAIAIIRLSGGKSGPIVCALTAGKVDPASAPPRTLIRANLRDERGGLLDDAMIAWFPGPGSYTGEDSAEIHVHGGAWVVSRVLQNLHARGARRALPGEFSFRAVRNGKMNLSQAEAVSDLIGAENEAAASLALEKMSGTQSKLVSELAEELRNLATFGEVGIDFADQDIEEVSLPALRKRAERARQRLQLLSESYARGSKIQSGVGTALLGLPNAGKSSFFNALLGEDRSIVSEIAGTTRDIVRERVTLSGTRASVTLRLEDTAGLRESSDPIEKIGIERTRQATHRADLLLLVVDARTTRETIDLFLTQSAAPISEKRRVIGVLSKCDLATPREIEGARAALSESGKRRVVETSAFTGAGIQEASLVIADECESMTHREAGEVLLTRESQAEAVNEAREHLDRALTAPQIELFAADLRQSLASLGPLIGETPAEEILTRIFSTFCIGK